MRIVHHAIAWVGIGTASFLGGKYVGEKKIENPISYQEINELLELIKKRDGNNDGRLQPGEAFHILDPNRTGHISREKEAYGKQLRERYENWGKAMLKTSENIDRALRINEE